MTNGTIVIYHFNNKRKWKKQKINAKVYKGESEQETFQ